MMYGIYEDGRKVPAGPGMSATCPVCGDELLPRCGEIRVWHWAHKSRRECDSWYEPETPWHQWWKSLVQNENVEVVRGKHRADIVGNDGIVIELQHSSISVDEIRAREAFYGDMIWLFDANVFRDNLESFVKEGESRSFWWRRPRKYMASIDRPLFWDPSERELVLGRVDGRKPLFQIDTMDWRQRFSGAGHTVSIGSFIGRYLSAVLKDDCYRFLSQGRKAKVCLIGQPPAGEWRPDPMYLVTLELLSPEQPEASKAVGTVAHLVGGDAHLELAELARLTMNHQRSLVILNNVSEHVLEAVSRLPGPALRDVRAVRDHAEAAAVMRNKLTQFASRVLISSRAPLHEAPTMVFSEADEQRNPKSQD